MLIRKDCCYYAVLPHGLEHNPDPLASGGVCGPHSGPYVPAPVGSAVRTSDLPSSRAARSIIEALPDIGRVWHLCAPNGRAPTTHAVAAAARPCPRRRGAAPRLRKLPHNVSTA